MRRTLRGFAVATAATVLITGLIAGSARLARAQSAEKQGDLGGPGVAAEPDAKAPIDVNGCWSGTLDDVYAGAGSGDVDFVQSGKQLLPPADEDMMYFIWNDGSYADGDGQGVATAKTFKFTIKYPTEKGCVAHVHGKLEGNDLVGVYSFTKVCARNNGFGKHKGSFDLTYDPTGDSCD